MITELSKVWKCVGLPNRATLEFHQDPFYTYMELQSELQWDKNGKLFGLLTSDVVELSSENIKNCPSLSLCKSKWDFFKILYFARKHADGKKVFIPTCRWSLWSVKTGARSWSQLSRTCEDKHSGAWSQILVCSTAVTTRLSRQLISLSNWIIEQLICMEWETGEEPITWNWRAVRSRKISPTCFSHHLCQVQRLSPETARSCLSPKSNNCQHEATNRENTDASTQHKKHCLSLCR